MKRALIFLTLCFVPGVAAAQDSAVDRIRALLPEALAEQVLARVDAARVEELPAQAVASLALEGVAKGRSAPEVLGALDAMLAELGQARQALVAGGHTPQAGEVEAASAAMRMGVDRHDVTAMAQAGPAGRSLAVPLLVLGGLNDRGLPADEALSAVTARMSQGLADSDLVASFPDVAQGLGPALRPDFAGLGKPGWLGGGLNPAGIMVPAGSKGDWSRPGRRPGGL